MDTPRVIMYAVLGLLVYFIIQQWQKDFPPQPQEEITYTQTNNQGLPDIEKKPKNAATEAILPKQEMFSQTSLVEVKTDVLKLKIDLNQGEIVEASLNKYPISLNDSAPIEILSKNINRQFVAKSQLVSMGDTGLNVDDFNFQTADKSYQLEKNKENLTIDLVGTNKNGIRVVKSYNLKRGSYLIEISYKIFNESAKAWKGYLNTQIVQSSPPESQGGLFQIGTYSGPSYSDPLVHKFKKYPFQSMEKNNLNIKTKGGWIAMQQHYFLVSFIPQEAQKNTLYTRAMNDTYTIGTLGQPIIVEPQETHTAEARLYIGPELTHILKNIAPSLDMTVDYGLLWFISSALFSVMKLIDAFVGNWGFTIILVTLLIKLCFYRLSASSYKSMAGMRNLQPKLEALKARFGEDKAKLSQATMELYRQEKINPFGVCLPIVIQIPVFIALYWVLIESVELRQAPFIFWIHDLSSPDPYHVLPVIMGISMLIQQRLNPAPPDPMQAKMMMFLPVLFTGIFWNFPAGLVLYWIVNNFLSILQQWWITKGVLKDGSKSTK